MTTFTDQQLAALNYVRKYPGRGIKEIASAAGVHHATLWRWRKKPAFAEAFDLAMAGEAPESDIVDIRQFILGSEYLNLGESIWPEVLRELRQIHDSPNDLVLLVGSIGCAKTYAAAISLLYDVYKLVSLDNPHAEFGLDQNTPIIFGVQNKTQSLARRNAFGIISNLIKSSPWFRIHAPHDEKLKSRIRFTQHNVEIWPAGGDPTDLLGMNLAGLLLDESNFFERTARSAKAVDGQVYDQASESFESAYRRKQSRFPHNKAGRFYVASSRRYKGQFTDVLEEEYQGECYLYSHTAWSINPDKFKDGGWFSVFIGDQSRPPRILDDDEILPEGDLELSIRVPSVFKRRFAANPVRSLQDIAGISTEAVGGFFRDREALARASVLSTDSLTSALEVVGDATLLIKPGLYGSQLDNPNSPRHVHLDLSLTGDVTGVACGHLTHYDDGGRPNFAIDCTARVRPPRGGEIRLDTFFDLIREWMAVGVPIASVSTDGYQSADLRQRLARLGLNTGKISADQTSPQDPIAAYESLRLAVAEGRVKLPRDDYLINELLSLQHYRDRNRIDHLPSTTKDVADCVACTVYHLGTIPSWQLVGKVAGAGFASSQPTLGGTVTPIYTDLRYEGFDSMMDLIRHQRGIGSTNVEH